jgi:superfamily II DNA/RNA helicase
VGRTGRFGTDGLALTLIVKGHDLEPTFMKKIAEAYSIEIKELKSFKDFEDIYRKMREKQSTGVI